MRLRRFELLGATVVLLYIVFFSLNPPAVVRSVLSTSVGLAAVFGAALYTTLYVSKAVGGLAILAFLLSMTKVTEHLDNPPATGSASTTGGASTTGSASTSGSASTTGSASTPAASGTTSSTSTTPPPATVPPVTSTTPPATGQQALAAGPIPQSTTATAPVPRERMPAASSAPPKPVMSCNIENFASF